MNRSRATRLAVLALAIASFTLPVRAGDVVVIAPLGGDGVALLQAAIDAAADGDIIILRDGNYLAPDSTPFVIDGKGVSVVVDEGHGRLFVRGFRVVDTPPGSLVLLRGLEMRGWDLGTQVQHLPLRAVDVEGALWVEDCTLLGEQGVWDQGSGTHQPARPAAVMERCASVTIERCTLIGGSGVDAAAPQGGGASALVLRETWLTMHDTNLEGGDVGDNFYSDSGAGDGLRVTVGSWAVLSGCTASGGNIQFPILSPKLAGDGVQVLADGSKLWLRANTLIPGVGSDPPGQAVNAPASAVKTFSGVSTAVAAGASMPAVVRVGQPVTLELVDGRAGDAAYVLLSLGGGFLAVPELSDGFMLDAGSFIGPRFLGSLDGNGDLSIPFVAPFLGPAIDGVPVLVQSIYSGFGGYTALGAGTGFLLVQTAF